MWSSCRRDASKHISRCTKLSVIPGLQEGDTGKRIKKQGRVRKYNFWCFSPDNFSPFHFGSPGEKKEVTSVCRDIVNEIGHRRPPVWRDIDLRLPFDHAALYHCFFIDPGRARVTVLAFKIDEETVRIERRCQNCYEYQSKLPSRTWSPAISPFGETPRRKSECAQPNQSIGVGKMPGGGQKVAVVGEIYGTHLAVGFDWSIRTPLVSHRSVSLPLGSPQYDPDGRAGSRGPGAGKRGSSTAGENRGEGVLRCWKPGDSTTYHIHEGRSAGNMEP